MVKVKICGITNLEDAKAVVNAGCDALGFVFYKRSPRYITPAKAAEIIKKIPGKALKIGVFVNAKETTIRNTAKKCGLDMLQLHGRESPQFCRKLKGYKIIKAFRIKDRISLKNILKYNTFAYLFDTFVNFKAGGTGRSFNWRLIRHIDGIKQPVFLSGGLTESNVKKAITIVRPEWVDVSSSLELALGKKDHKKVRKFIKAVKKSEV